MAKRTGHISVRLPSEMYQEINRLMKLEGRNLTNMIERLLSLSIKKHYPKNNC